VGKLQGKSSPNRTLGFLVGICANGVSSVTP
jgi:hypothetical protein